MSALGVENGSRRRFQLAMMEPKKAIPVSPIEESEKIMTGPLGSGKPAQRVTPDPGFPESKGYKLPPGMKEPTAEELKQKPFTEQEMAAGKWISENIAKSKQPSMHEIASKGIDNIYKVSDEFTNKWAVKGETELSSLKPVNWKDLQNRYMRVDLPEQAKQLGFSEEYPFYKGGRRGVAEGPLPDPSVKQTERGQFFAEEPRIAGHYARAGTEPVEYVAAPKNAATIDLKGQWYDEDRMHSIVEAARKQGHDLVVIQNIRDIGSNKPQNQIVVTDPSIVRSPNAKFDPNVHHINDVLATLLAAAGAGAITKELNPDKNK